MADTPLLPPAAPEGSAAGREKVYRRNFGFFLADAVLFTVAMGIIGPTTVIPDFVRRLTNSEILIGLAGNVFTVGFALPQLFIARHIVRHQKKKWWFVGPNIPTRFVILLFAGVLLVLGKSRPHLVLGAFFLCYWIAALGDGLVGVPWAVLAGSSLDNRWRARVFGLSSMTTGIVVLLIAPLVGFILGPAGPGFPDNFTILFAASGAVFALSIIPGLFFHELPGGRVVDKTPTFAEFFPQIGRLLREDVPFRSFIVMRVLTSLFLMAAPFYIGYATVVLGLSSAVAVPVLLAMQTIGTVSGALFYSWLGARSNLTYIRIALGAAALLPVSALVAGVVGPAPLYVGFLLSGLATSNLNFGYLNWVVGYAGHDRRATYVGLANTITALVSLIAPVIAGTIVQQLGYTPLFVVALTMVLCALSIAFLFLKAGAAETPDRIEG
ncbi:MAG: MFS transporter [Spirochaetaceae bacterium]|nr:MAG: MFS transporter [Spirochaetaceae bacterium]